MSWEIVVGIITLVGAVISVGSIVYKLSGTLQKLQSTLDALQTIITELKNVNTNEHKEFYKRFNDIENRLQALEIKFNIAADT